MNLNFKDEKKTVDFVLFEISSHLCTIECDSSWYLSSRLNLKSSVRSDCGLKMRISKYASSKAIQYSFEHLVHVWIGIKISIKSQKQSTLSDPAFYLTLSTIYKYSSYDLSPDNLKKQDMLWSITLVNFRGMHFLEGNLTIIEAITFAVSFFW